MRRTSTLSFAGDGKSTSPDRPITATPNGENRKVLKAFSEKIKKQSPSKASQEEPLPKSPISTKENDKPNEQRKIASQPILKEDKKKPEKKKFDLSRFRNKNYVPPPPSSLVNPSTSKRKRSQKEQEELASESPNESDADSEPSGVESDSEGERESSDESETKSKPQSDEDERNEVSSYEKKRMENIQANMAILQSMGLASASEYLGLNKKAAHKKKKAKKIDTTPSLNRAYTLRSNKKDGESLVSLDDEGASSVAVKPEKEEVKDEDFQDSSLFKYLCEDDSETSNKNSNELEISPKEGQFLKGFSKVEKITLYDESLSKIYSMNYNSTGRLLAAGGHGGHVSVYGMDFKASDSKPLLSFKAHKGWISQIQFIGDLSDLNSNSNSSSDRLLTSANDKQIIIWDISKQGEMTKKAKELIKIDTLHTNGIFSLQEKNKKLITASKDTTVCYSAITNSSIQKIKSFSGYSDSVVKTARFRCSDENIFAMGGNDMVTKIMDVRAKDPLVFTFNNFHDFAINSISWHPSDENILMSAGFDTKIVMYDVRNPEKALHILKNHVNTTLTRCKNIYNPIFVANGNEVATAGEKTNYVTLYSTITGGVVSKGLLGFEPQTITSKTDATTQLVASFNKFIYLFAPKWENAVQ